MCIFTPISSTFKLYFSCLIVCLFKCIQLCVSQRKNYIFQPILYGSKRMSLYLTRWVYQNKNTFIFSSISLFFLPLFVYLHLYSCFSFCAEWMCFKMKTVFEWCLWYYCVHVEYRVYWIIIKNTFADRKVCIRF